MTSQVNSHSLAFYVVGFAALVLLAPYAGCHLLTKRPLDYEEQQLLHNSSSKSTTRTPKAKAATPKNPKPKAKPFSELDEILQATE